MRSKAFSCYSRWRGWSCCCLGHSPLTHRRPNEVQQRTELVYCVLKSETPKSQLSSPKDGFRGGLKFPLNPFLKVYCGTRLSTIGQRDLEAQHLLWTDSGHSALTALNILSYTALAEPSRGDGKPSFIFYNSQRWAQAKTLDLSSQTQSCR